MNPYPDAVLFGLTVFLQITLVAGLALIAIRMAGSHRAAIRHAIAICALAAILLSPVLTFFMRHYEVSVLSFELKEKPMQSYYNAELSALNGISERIVAEMEPNDLSGALVSPIERLQVNPPINLRKSHPDGLRTTLNLLFVAWSVGAIFMLFRLIYGLGFQYACLRKGRLVEMDQYPVVLERLALVLNRGRVPQIVSSGLVDHPLAVGLIRQRIILPAAMLEEFDEDRLSDVLIHECSHVVHGDLLVGFLQRIAAIVFWPHPWLHMLNRKLARAREEICDNHVLRVSQPHHYAQTLLDMTAVDAGDCRIPGTVGLLGFNWKLEDRIKGLLDKRRNMTTQTKKWKTGLVFSAFFTGTLMVSLVTVQGAPANTEQQTQVMKQQVNAILLDLAHRKEAEIKTLAQELGIDVPPEFQELVDAIKSNAGMAKLLEIQEKLNREVGQYPESESNRLHSPLWSGPVLDLLGAAAEMQTWSSPMLSLYAHGILDSIPNESIYFGGTDPGRFLITAFNTSTNNDSISIITQNALADQPYMQYLRSVYGKTLTLPTQKDFNAVFAELVQEDQGKTDGIKQVNGQIKIEGVKNVMKLNAKLSKLIFEKNKESHGFYIEESYAIPWMYPYLEPHGFIMKLNPNPIEFSDEMIERDALFWDELCKHLKQNDSFATDVMAQKSMAKLRTSLAGLYVYHQRHTEAEVAFKQAMELCPSGLEPVARLANLYVSQGRNMEAKELLAQFVIQNPAQKNAAKLLKRINNQ